MKHKDRHPIVVVLLMLFFVLIALLSVLWLSMPAASASETAVTANPNIIFVVVDAMRADHLSSYGYQRNTSPNVDVKVADQGVLFADVTAASSWTNPSNGATLTSHFPSSIDIDWAELEDRLPEQEMLLAEYLHNAGYRTAGFVSNWWLRARYGYDQGFDHYEHSTGEERERAYVINELAQKWLEDNLASVESSGQPLFLYLYYMDPHTLYDPPAPYDTLYDSTYTGTMTPELFGHGNEVVSGDIVPTNRDVEHLLALYDGEITYWDFQFDKMLSYLGDRGLLDNSIVVITSDHGEMFGEHGKWTHGSSLYEEVLRVPLLIRYPGMLAAGQIVNTPVHMMDITPTLLDLLGVPIPGHMEGQSLLPVIQGSELAESRPIFSEMAGETDTDGVIYWLAPHTNLHSVKKDGWKIIHAERAAQADELYLVQPSSLYEEESLIVQEPEKADQLFQELRDRFGIPTEFLYLPVLERK